MKLAGEHRHVFSCRVVVRRDGVAGRHLRANTIASIGFEASVVRVDDA